VVKVTITPPRPPGAATEDLTAPGNASGVSAAAAVCANIRPLTIQVSFDMQCPPETLKMTPVSLYNTASSDTLKEEGF